MIFINEIWYWKRFCEFLKYIYQSKWVPNYWGPCIVNKEFSGGALILSDIDGGVLSKPLNLDVVKKYYA
jgi:hypothetical protein